MANTMPERIHTDARERMELMVYEVMFLKKANGRNRMQMYMRTSAGFIRGDETTAGEGTHAFARNPDVRGMDKLLQNFRDVRGQDEQVGNLRTESGGR